LSQPSRVKTRSGQSLGPIWFAIIFVKLSLVEGYVWQIFFVLPNMALQKIHKKFIKNNKKKKMYFWVKHTKNHVFA